MCSLFRHQEFYITFVLDHNLSILLHSNDTEILCVHESLEFQPILSQLNPLKVGLSFLEIFLCHGDILDAPISRDALASRLYSLRLRHESVLYTPPTAFHQPITRNIIVSYCTNQMTVYAGILTEDVFQYQWVANPQG